MRIVSFKVAKALKEAGYLQFSEGYYYNHNGERFVNPEEGTLEEDDYFAPPYLEVWLWLQRKKKIAIEPVAYGCRIFMEEDGYDGKFIESNNDSEDAIIAGIEHLVANNLIK